jgi:hypothetical protein
MGCAQAASLTAQDILILASELCAELIIVMEKREIMADAYQEHAHIQAKYASTAAQTENVILQAATTELKTEMKLMSTVGEAALTAATQKDA